MSINEKPHNWDSLPRRTIIVAGKKYNCRYDSESKTVYLLQPDGTWNGAKHQYDLDAAQAPQPKEPESLDPNAPESPAELTADEKSDTALSGQDLMDIFGPDDPDEPKQEKESPPPPKKQEPKENKPIPKWLILVVAIVMIIVSIVTISIKSRNDAAEQPTANPELQEQPTSTEEPTEVTTPTEAPVQTETPTEEPTEPATEPPTEAPMPVKTVLSATRDILPGESLTDVLAPVELEETLYWQLAATCGLYTAEDNISHMVAVQYIHAGKYLNYEDAGLIYEPVNPWSSVENTTELLILPIMVEVDKLPTIAWGQMSKITITSQTSQQDTVTPEEESNPDGLQHESSVLESTIVDTYTIQAVITDWYDADGSSLWADYVALAQIPSGLQEKTLQALDYDKYKPCSIAVALTKAQYDVLSALDTAAMTVEIQESTPYAITELQSNMSENIRNIIAAAMRVWNQED